MTDSQPDFQSIDGRWRVIVVIGDEKSSVQLWDCDDSESPRLQAETGWEKVSPGFHRGTTNVDEWEMCLNPWASSPEELEDDSRLTDAFNDLLSAITGVMSALEEI